MSTNTYPIFFESAFLGSSNAGIYTVTGNTNTILQELTLKFTNVTAATRQITIYAFSSGLASNTNAIAVNHSVPPNDYILLPIPRILKGGSIQGFCDAAASVNVQAIGGRLHTP